MKIRITLLLLSCHLFTFSQISFQEKITLLDESHSPFNVNSIITSDLDNDNFRDLIIASYDDKVVWYKNVNGDFTAQQRNLISDNIDIPSCVGSADLNNDGLNDIIVTSSSAQDKIVWFKNLGNGNFSDEIIILNPINGPSAIETVDIDDDGDIDILTGGQNDTVLLIENNNDETFQAPIEIYDGNSDTRLIKSIDLNNDNLLDIVSAHSSGIIYWSKNLGSNTFEDKQYLTHSSSFDFIDINNDGFMDIVTSSSFNPDDIVRCFLNEAGNSFNTSNPIIIENSIQDPYQVRVKDMDNDGIDDIVVSFWNEYKLSWYKNYGIYNLIGPSNLVSDNIYNGKSFVIDDFDNNGVNDIISSSGSSTDSKVSLLENQNNGSLFIEKLINHNYGFPNKIKISDLNNDNQEDIIIAAKDIIWFENYGTDFSSYRLISSNNSANAFDPNIIIEDINDDGYKDILGFYGTYISILTNDTDETFTEQIFQYTGFNNPIYADFDGDGLKDILVSIPTSSIEHHIGFIKRLNNTTLDTMQIIDIPLHNGTTYYRVWDMAPIDVENDGDMDVLLSSSTVSAIKIMRNDGLGNFTFEDATNNGNIVPYSNKEIHIEDIDNDNFDDIILYRHHYDNQASANSYVIIQIKNNQGNLIGNDSYIDNTGTAAVSALTFTDIDNNGYKDIFCATSSYLTHNIEETIFYYLNDGVSFQPRVYVDNQGNMTSYDRDIVLDDINNDNKPDIITSIYGEDIVEYYLNNSTLSIAEYETDNDDYIFYPVPFSNTLSWRSETEQNFSSLNIYNIDGKKVFSKDNFQESKINLEFLKPGIYLIKIRSSDNSEITRKVIKK